MTHSQAAAPQHRRRGLLSESLVVLAGTPDDHSDIDDQLVAVAILSADRIAAVSYASITARRADAYTTVAASSEIALAVDEAQYADETGPCLDALATGAPLPVPDIATTMRWPGFRDTAFGLGLRASLSIPLFAGKGAPVAALNLYGHEAPPMAALSAAVWAVCDDTHAVPDVAGLCDGGVELVDGLTDAFAVRAVIQQAIGLVIAERRTSVDDAYAELRLRAADTGMTLAQAAASAIGNPRFFTS